MSIAGQIKVCTFLSSVVVMSETEKIKLCLLQPRGLSDARISNADTKPRTFDSNLDYWI
jgi:hypothetical protein